MAEPVDSAVRWKRHRWGGYLYRTPVGLYLGHEPSPSGGRHQLHVRADLDSVEDAEGLGLAIYEAIEAWREAR